MKKCRIFEERFLKNGSRYWPGDLEEALLISYNGSFSRNGGELFGSYEMGENLLPLLKNWNYDEVICSALSFYYHLKPINSLDWARILAFLLFPYNKTTSSFVLSFLKNNFFSIELSQKDIFTGNRRILTEVPPSNIRLHNLSNFLHFLQIPETDKNILIENCRKGKNYFPVLKYLQNRDSILLDTDLAFTERRRIREDTFFGTDFDSERGPP